MSPISTGVVDTGIYSQVSIAVLAFPLHIYVNHAFTLSFPLQTPFGRHCVPSLISTHETTVISKTDAHRSTSVVTRCQTVDVRPDAILAINIYV